MTEYLLSMNQIVKQFPGTLALDHVDFNLKAGEVMALIGENGAGKSTLMNVLMGILQPDSGEIILNGEKIENKSPYEALQKKIGMVPQELNLVPDLSIAENIFLGCHQKKGRRMDWGQTVVKAKEMMEKLEVDIDPGIKVSEVSAAYQQLVSIARTLVFGSNIIILDEPTASLTLNETEHLFRNVRKLKEEGKAIIIITHHLDEVQEISDRVTIMRDGKFVKACDTKDISIDEMIYHMANQKVEKNQRVERQVSDEIFLEVKNFSRGREFKDISFEVKKGEIYGVAGLVGAGRTELFTCIYGLTQKDSGRLFLDGAEINIHSPAEAIAHGIGLVPEERRKQGMFPVLSICENIMMLNYDKVKGRGKINFSKAKEIADYHIEALRIKTPGADTLIKNLSGGNQQKVILGRWMERNVKLLILDEPTRGIDVRAKGEIYKLVREMADMGITIIVISSEMDELLTIADRIMIMNAGRLKGVLTPDEDMAREDLLKVALN